MDRQSVITLRNGSVPIVSALEAAGSSLHPTRDLTDGSFVLRTSAKPSPEARSARNALQSRLDRRDPAALVHVLDDALIQTTHWMVRVGAGLVEGTRYLIHDEHLARNLDMLEPESSIELDSARTWIHGLNYAPGNYWHWHAQSLPAILHCLETVPTGSSASVGVLTGPLLDWQRSGLHAIGLSDSQIRELPRGRTAFAKRLLYSDLLSSVQTFSVNEQKVKSRAMLRTYAIDDARAATPGAGPRIYVSRGDSRRRPLLNERKLENALGKAGFVAIRNSEYSLPEQIGMFDRAQVVVAPHGAGSTNLLFMRPGSAFVELQQASHVNAGPLSLGKTSGIVAYVDAYADDGQGQATSGWEVDIEQTLDLVTTIPGK